MENKCATFGCNKLAEHREYVRDIDGTGRGCYLYWCHKCWTAKLAKDADIARKSLQE